MTVSQQVLSEQYAGDGAQLDFEFAFLVDDEEEVVVTVIDSGGTPEVQTLPTDYTVELNDDGTGTVTMVTAPAIGQTLDLRPVFELLQSANVRNQGRFLPEVHEQAFDRLTMFNQYLYRLVRRCLRLPDVSDDTTGLMEPRDSWLGRYPFINTDGELEPAVAIEVTTLTQSIIAQLLNPQTAAEAVALVTPTDHSVPSHEKVGVILASRYDFSEDASESTNLTALQRARAVAVALGGGIIMLPPGEFDLTEECTISADDIVIVGQGSLATRINFNPSGTAVCFNFDGGGSSLERVGVIGVGFKSSNSNNKTAIRFEDCRDFKTHDIGIADGAWAGSGSIGIHTLGRDTFDCGKFHILCARPFVIDVNPNNATIDCDHFHIHDYEIGSTETAGKAFEIVNGAHLTNVTWDGYGAIVLGKHGIFYDDTTAAIDSFNVKITGLRTEQATDATGYSVYLASTAQDIKAISIENCNFDSGRNGVFLRKPECVSIRNCFFTGGAGRTNLDITFQSKTLLDIEGTELGALSTVTLTNAVQVKGAAQNTSTEVIPKTAQYRFDEGALVSRKCRRDDGVLHFSYKGTIGDDVTINLPITQANGADVCHLRIALGSATGPVLEGGNVLWRPGTAALAGVTANVVTTNTDTKLCILDSGNALIVLNRLGGTMDIVVDAVWSD